LSHPNVWALSATREIGSVGRKPTRKKNKTIKK
jgi:hypothetical protein